MVDSSSNAWKCNQTSCAAIPWLSRLQPFHLPNRSGPCDNIFTRKRPSAAVK
jgi:hypothetical protein